MSKKRDAFWGSLIGDALGMPGHWFYDQNEIYKVYSGWINGYMPPKDQHYACGLGKQSNASPAIGSCILHDKRKLWTSAKEGTHYHQGMHAGDNTLNSLCAIVVAKTLATWEPSHSASPEENIEKVLEEWVKFMTTPNSHNDTWAEGFIRKFFEDWQPAGSPRDGKSILQFAQNRREKQFEKGVDASYHMMGGLVMGIPWILHYSDHAERECLDAVWKFLSITHPSQGFRPFVDLFASALYKVLKGASLREVATRALSDSVLVPKPNYHDIRKQLSLAKTSGEQLKILQVVSKEVGLDCKISNALQIVFFLAAEYADNFEAGVLTNVKVGGDTCHRGAALGALLGANASTQAMGIPKTLKTDLTQATALRDLFSDNYLA